MRHQTVYERLAPPPALVDRALHGSEHRVFWLDDVGQRAAYEPLRGTREADLVVVGGGYCGLWTAVLAKRRSPGRRVVVLEAHRVGWAASGRNGGFCEASITHGEANGRSRWPEEYPLLERLGQQNLHDLQDDVRDLGLDAQLETTGMLEVAVEEHQVDWLRERGSAGFLDTDGVRAQIDSPIFRAGDWDRTECVLVHPARLVMELARVAVELGVEIHEHSPVVSLDTASQGPITVVTEGGSVVCDQVAVATNVYPSPVRRARPLTVPVYDYVLMTEPLTPTQLAEIGWSGRQGFADLANKFHYSRLSADNRILYGGYDAVYHPGGRVRPGHEEREATYRTLASHFLTTFPQLEDVRFAHRWAGPIDTCTRFAAFHGLSRSGRIAWAGGFTGLGVGATRFAAQVMLDRLGGVSTERTCVEMVRKAPLPFPPEPVASLGIALTTWSLDRADHHQGRRNLLLRTLDRLGLGFDS